MIVVVSDTSPIRALHHIDHLSLLRSLYGRIVIPSAVAEELQTPRGQFQPILTKDMPFIEVLAPVDRAMVQTLLLELNPGESEAIVVAREIGATALLIDEKKGRAFAENAGLRTIGAVGVLIEAKQNGLLNYVIPLVDRLRSELGFFISDSLYSKIRKLTTE